MLRDREDSAKKSFTGRPCRTLFSVSQFDLGWVPQICGSSLSFLSHALGFTRLLPHALPIVVLVVYFWLLKPEFVDSPPPSWKGGGVWGTLTGLSSCSLEALELDALYNVVMSLETLVLFNKHRRHTHRDAYFFIQARFGLFSLDEILCYFISMAAPPNIHQAPLCSAQLASEIPMSHMGISQASCWRNKIGGWRNNIFPLWNSCANDRSWLVTASETLAPSRVI